MRRAAAESPPPPPGEAAAAIGHVESLGDDIHLHVLNNSYDRMCP
jgi:hypothetical protein